jgi:predicted GNAT superfamily acetyltransferase
MKQYEVKMVKVLIGPNSSEKLREETEKTINAGTAMGYKLFKVDFEFASEYSYIYSYIIFEK